LWLATVAASVLLLGLILWPFLGSLGPAEALQDPWGPVSVDLSDLGTGKTMVVKWRDRPILILRRSVTDVARLSELDDRLFDPRSAIDPDPPYIEKGYRSIRPEYFVMESVSTYCGCSLVYTKETFGWDLPGGLFYDSCHTGVYDVAGRLLAETAVTPPPSCYPRMRNARIPPYRFSSEREITIGEDPD